MKKVKPFIALDPRSNPSEDEKKKSEKDRWIDILTGSLAAQFDNALPYKKQAIFFRILAKVDDCPEGGEIELKDKDHDFVRNALENSKFHPVLARYVYKFGVSIGIDEEEDSE